MRHLDLTNNFIAKVDLHVPLHGDKSGRELSCFHRFNAKNTELIVLDLRWNRITHQKTCMKLTEAFNVEGKTESRYYKHKNWLKYFREQFKSLFMAERDKEQYELRL